MSKEKEKLFAILIEAKEYDKPLIQTDLTFSRLIDDIILPQENNKPFFVDGVPITKDKIYKLKILRQKESFSHLFHEFHYKLRHGDVKRQKIYGDQYYIRLEAIMRIACEDVTSQMIRAFDKKIKPHLKDYMPRREEIIQAAATFFWEGIKKLGSI